MRAPRPTSKLAVVLLALAGAGVLLASGGRTWVRGTVDDAVLGASRVSGSGRDVASGVVALALVSAAAALAATTSGPVVRRVTLSVLGLAGVAEGVLAVRILADPARALGGVAARAAGRTGSLGTHATATSWPWLCLLASLLLLASAAGGLAGSGHWRGLGARYETPAATTAGARGQRVASDWDRLDAGEDPTVTT
ncbi:Trp biosynthesis-associated membrane protein [Pedococcus sp. 5OH_020]|uniref:Trp biosynthesis-associated membrane protein n=1 Tax=Pedococcus sp. 5OH_020 TaxID=2989814 RepID=UPI0022E9E3AA|nr:Trp biosynthesis-associated membrane protein [Pedococcus sp. 5OH_020]